MSIRDLFNQLIRPNQNGGPSSTKLVYLQAGVLSAYSAFLGTMAAIGRFMAYGTADPTWCGFLVGLWGIVIGFASGAKKHAAEQTRDITINAKLEDSK